MAGQQSKKSRKHGRNAISCKAYRSSGRREVNKTKRLAKVLVRNPNDRDASEALHKLIAYHVHARNELKREHALKAAAVLGSKFDSVA